LWYADKSKEEKESEGDDNDDDDDDRKDADDEDDVLDDESEEYLAKLEKVSLLPLRCSWFLFTPFPGRRS